MLLLLSCVGGEMGSRYICYEPQRMIVAQREPKLDQKQHLQPLSSIRNRAFSNTLPDPPVSVLPLPEGGGRVGTESRKRALRFEGFGQPHETSRCGCWFGLEVVFVMGH